MNCPIRTPPSTVGYTLPQPDEFIVSIVATTGEGIRRPVIGPQDARYHIMRWDVHDSHGEEVANGIYFCRVQSTMYAVVRTRSLVVQR